MDSRRKLAPLANDNRIDAVVFDLDGVLLDTDENMRRAFSEAWKFAFPRDPVPIEEFQAMLGAPLGEILSALGLPIESREVFMRVSTEWQSLVEPFNHIPALIAELERIRLPMAIATGKSLERAKEALYSAGIDDKIKTIVGSDMVDKPKPAPESLHLALSLLSEDAGRRQLFKKPVYVGDAPRDIQAAKSAGMLSVAVGWGQAPVQALLDEGPDYFLPTVPALTDWLAVAAKKAEKPANASI